MDEVTLCQKFLENPTVNPKNGKKLLKDLGPYQEYVNLCKKHNVDLVPLNKSKEVSIVSDEITLCRKFLENPDINPRTGKKLLRNLGPHKKYIELCRKYNFNIDDHLDGESDMPIISNIEGKDYFSLLTNDLIIHKIIMSDNNDFKILCLCNKRLYAIYQAQDLWQELYNSKYKGNSTILFANNNSYYETCKLCFRLTKFLERSKRLAQNYDTINALYHEKELSMSLWSLLRIPKELSYIVNLETLNLSNNCLSKLSGIDKLSNLSSLNLSINKLEKLSSKIFKLSNLRNLDLSSNLISEIPDDISKLTELVSLKLNKCDINKISPKITTLTNLEVLRLDTNELIKFPHLPLNLRILDLSENEIESIPPEITDLSRLESLKLDDNEIADIQLENLKFLNKINISLKRQKSKLKIIRKNVTLELK